MPFVANGVDDEDEKKQGPVAPVSGGAVHLAPSSGVGAAGPGAAGSAPQKDAGGQFASLDKYITANQGQAAPLADKITGGINDKYNTLSQGNQATIQNISGQVQNAPGYTKGDSGLLSKEQGDVVSFANDPNNVAAFQKQLTNSYGGPNSAEGTSEYQTQQAKLNDAIAKGNTQTTTSAGRKQLVQDNTASRNSGATALNSAILSEDPTYLGKVQDAYKPFNNLVSGLGTGAADVNKTIAQEQADATSSSKAAKDALTGQMTGLNTAVQGQLTAAQQAAASQNVAVKNSLTTGSASPQTLQALGLNQDQWNALTAAQKAAATSDVVRSADNKFVANSGTANVDLNQWLKQQDPNAAISASNVANVGQYDQAKAFQTLLSGLNLDTPALAINPADAAKAGTAPTNLNSYDYQGALGTANDAESTSNAAAKSYVDALQQGADEEHAQAQAANARKNASAMVTGNPFLSTTAGAVNNAVNTAPSNIVNAITHPSIQNTANLATTQAKAVGNAVSNTVQSGVNTVKNIFCFHPGTLIEMADGTAKPICDVQVGDYTKGGMVLGTTRGIGTEFYWYRNVLVTGKHAVKENGRWLRVETSPVAKKYPQLTEVVCNLVTQDHRIWAHGVEFADNHETDLYEYLDLDESLIEMNKHV